MCNININYKSAITLKQALRDQIQIKQRLIEAGIKFDEQEIKYIEQDIKTLTDFTNKVETKWGERKRREQAKYPRHIKKVNKDNSYLEVIKSLIQKNNTDKTI